VPQRNDQVQANVSRLLLRLAPDLRALLHGLLQADDRLRPLLEVWQVPEEDPLCDTDVFDDAQQRLLRTTFVSRIMHRLRAGETKMSAADLRRCRTIVDVLLHGCVLMQHESRAISASLAMRGHQRGDLQQAADAASQLTDDGYNTLLRECPPMFHPVLEAVRYDDWQVFVSHDPVSMSSAEARRAAAALSHVLFEGNDCLTEGSGPRLLQAAASCFQLPEHGALREELGEALHLSASAPDGPLPAATAHEIGRALRLVLPRLSAAIDTLVTQADLVPTPIVATSGPLGQDALRAFRQLLAEQTLLRAGLERSLEEFVRHLRLPPSEHLSEALQRLLNQVEQVRQLRWIEGQLAPVVEARSGQSLANRVIDALAALAERARAVSNHLDAELARFDYDDIRLLDQSPVQLLIHLHNLLAATTPTTDEPARVHTSNLQDAVRELPQAAVHLTSTGRRQTMDGVRTSQVHAQLHTDERAPLVATLQQGLPRQTTELSVVSWLDGTPLESPVGPLPFSPSAPSTALFATAQQQLEQQLAHELQQARVSLRLHLPGALTRLGPLLGEADHIHVTHCEEISPTHREERFVLELPHDTVASLGMQNGTLLHASDLVPPWALGRKMAGFKPLHTQAILLNAGLDGKAPDEGWRTEIADFQRLRRLVRAACGQGEVISREQAINVWKRANLRLVEQKGSARDPYLEHVTEGYRFPVYTAFIKTGDYPVWFLVESILKIGDIAELEPQEA
jgi:hypothetical protein